MYVAAVEALRKKERGLKLRNHQHLVLVLKKFMGKVPISS
jgi:hypothetical protein